MTKTPIKAHWNNLLTLAKFSREGLHLLSELASIIMDQVADVDIDQSGVYKYILIKLTDKKSGGSKVVVRGYSWADYHGELGLLIATAQL